MNFLSFAFVAVLVAGAGWLVVTYVLPARRLQKTLREIAEGDWEAATFVQKTGRLAEGFADLGALGERLHEAERRLGDSSFELRAILGSLAEGVLIVDAAQRIRLANESLLRMFDLGSVPLERTVMETFRNHDLLETLRAALDGEVPQNRQIALEAWSGGGYVRKHFAVTAAVLGPLGAGPQPRGAIAIFHDISELKALEAVRKDFVANVSHELRTPVAIINGTLENLIDGALDDRAMTEKSLGVMWKNTQRLMALIEELLSLSWLEGKGAAALQTEAVDLQACLERVVERLEPTIAEKAASVRLAVPSDLPVIEADPARLDQVFFNLIENSLKYGEAERREIVVKAALLDETIEITVADNGPGIPAADQAHVFERFYRVRKDRSRAVGGTGLGLSIVKHAVLAHGGEVGVESQPGKGAVFRMRLPVGRRMKDEG